MVLEKISSSEYHKMIADGITSRDPSVDTEIGDVPDIFIDPFSDVLEIQSERISYLSYLNSLKYANKVLPDHLDDLVYNEGVVRWDASRSLVVVTFSRSQVPTVDISVPVNFPMATLVDQNTGVSILFRTIESKTMFAAAASSYYNASNGKYELDVSAASIYAGVETSVGANTIKVMRRQLVGFDDIYNKEASVPGRGVEDNLDLANRYMLHVEGSKTNTPVGLKKDIMDNFNAVDDSYIVYGNSPYMTRDQVDTGCVDAWIKGDAPIALRFNTKYPGIETLIPMDKQPIMKVSSVSDGITNFVEGVDYEVIIGQGEYGYSNRSQDGIKFLAGGAHPVNINDPIVVDYQYNSLMNILTSYFTQQVYYTMGDNVLFRWAKKKSIQIEATLKVSSGNPTSVMNVVRTTVINYIRGLNLGDDVEEFDIDREVSKVFGVDNWVYTTLSVVGGTGVNDITVGPNEYAYIEESDFVVSLVS